MIREIEINNSNYENNAVDVWLYLCYTLAYRISELCGTDWRKERLEKALYCIDKALECKSKYADNLWHSKADLLFYLGRYEEATKTYDKALEYGDIIKFDGMLFIIIQL